MLRIVALCAVVGMLLLPAAIRPGASPAIACGIGPDPIEGRVRQAAFVGLVDVVDVGGPENQQPTLTPTPAPTRTATPRSPSGDARTQTATPSATPSRPLFVYTLHLTGFGATLNVVERYAGDLASPIEVDAADRARIERGLRYFESNPGIAPPCELDLVSARFERGARYLVLIDDTPDFPRHTTRAFRVDGDAMAISSRGLEMSLETYRRLFSALPAEPIDDPEDPRVYLTTDRVPLETFVRAIKAIRSGDTRITPPETGSAGLAAGRSR